MKCQNCGQEFSGKFCGFCGQKASVEQSADDQLHNTLRKCLIDGNETILAVIGRQEAQTFCSTGQLKKGFVFLSDKRVYVRGNYLTRNGKAGFRKAMESKVLDTKDVISTGFVHSSAILLGFFGGMLLVIAVLTAFFGALASFLHATNTATWFFLGGVASLLSGSLLLGLYMSYTYSVFEISHIGGSIAFDIQRTPIDECKEFQKCLNKQKEQLSAKER